MTPREYVKSKDPVALMALVVSVIVAMVAVMSYASSPTKDLEVRTRALEARIPAIEEKLQWIKESQIRIEKQLSDRNRNEYLHSD